MIRQTLFSGWDFMRWLRLVLGITIAFQAYQAHDMLLGFMSAFLLFQTATNTGCCGTNGCSVPVSRNDSAKIEDVEFEEVKQK